MSDFIQGVEQKIAHDTATFAMQHGGEIHLVSAAPHVASAANDILASISSVGRNIVGHSGLGAAVGLMAGLPLVHELGTGAAVFAAGAGAIGNIISSVTSSSKGKIGGR